MAQQTINLGSTANDGTGDPLRSGGEKINSNFTELYGRTQNLEDNQVTGVVQYSTLAELPTTGTLNVSYKVTNDPTSSNNGYYHWNGSVYVKDASLANGEVEIGNTEAVEGGKINTAIEEVNVNDILDKKDINLFNQNYTSLIASSNYEEVDFKIGKRYKITITSSINITVLQIATSINNIGGLVDTSDIVNNILTYTYEFISSADAPYLFFYIANYASQVDVDVSVVNIDSQRIINIENDIEVLEPIVLDNEISVSSLEQSNTEIINILETITESQNFKENYILLSAAANFENLRFEVGKEYKIVLNSTVSVPTFQCGVALSGSGDAFDLSPVINNTTSYEYIFTCTANAWKLFFYISNYASQTDVNIEVYETITKDSERLLTIENDISKDEGNSVVLYEYLGTSDVNVESTGWTVSLNGITQDVTGISTPLYLKKSYALSNKQCIYDFKPSLNSTVAIFTKSNLAETGETFFGQGSFVSVDFSVGTINIHAKFDNTNIPSILKTVPFQIPSFYTNRFFRLKWERIKRGMKITLIDLLDFSEVTSIYIDNDNPALTIATYGMMYDYWGIAATVGTVTVNRLLALAPKSLNGVDVMVFGDSITDNVLNQEDDGYAFRLKNTQPKIAVSGRGGGTINGVLARIQSEAAFLLPKRIIVTIGTNGGNTTPLLEQLVTDIESIGAIPIINTIPCTSAHTQGTINNMILAIDVKHIRMDNATALDYDISNGADASLFHADGVHPTEEGQLRMFNRIKIDCPEI